MLNKKNNTEPVV